MPDQIGRYRFILAGCAPGFGGLTYGWSPYYGVRRVGLLSIKREVTQILVDCLGGLTWININPADLYPDTEPDEEAREFGAFCRAGM